MLYTPGNHFNWQVDNFGTFSEAAFGTNCPGHANANTKGADTQLLAGIAEDCYAISIGFAGGSTNTAIRRAMTDIIIDPAAGAGGAGSSWSVAIANLYTNSPLIGSGNFGHWFYFPLYLKAGTAIGAAHQDLVSTNAALRVGVRVYGKPTRPELLRVGTAVQTLGATTGTTTGVAVTPGTSGAWGSYSASLGTLSKNSWFWQIGIGSNDASMNQGTTLYDVAANATNKIICLQEAVYLVMTTTENSSKTEFGSDLPMKDISAGQDVYVRANCFNSAADTGMTAVVYAVS